jgi:hypothetical protein
MKRGDGVGDEAWLESLALKQGCEAGYEAGP